MRNLKWTHPDFDLRAIKGSIARGFGSGDYLQQKYPSDQG
jgi:hypothetical protein